MAEEQTRGPRPTRPHLAGGRRARACSSRSSCCPPSSRRGCRSCHSSPAEPSRRPSRRSPGIEPAIKFPNDVLVGGRKVAGILAESSEGRVVLGIGVNVNQTLEQLADGRADRADLAPPRARRAGRPRAAARGDPAAARARLRRLGYGYLSVRLTFPAASGRRCGQCARAAARKEKAPARTARVTRFPFTVRRTVAGSLTRKRSFRKERARSAGATVSILNDAVCTTVPMSFVAVSRPGVLPVLQTGWRSRRPSAGPTAGRPSRPESASSLPGRSRAEPPRHA